MSIGVTGGQLGGAITDTSGGREQELSKARTIDPRVLRQAPNLNRASARRDRLRQRRPARRTTTNLATISDVDAVPAQRRARRRAA